MSQPHTGPRTRKAAITWSKVLTDEETQQLLSYLEKNAVLINDKKLWLICDIMIHTGLRFLELAKLRVQDTPMILGKSFILVYMGKGGKDRQIEVGSRIAKAIETYVKKIRPKTLPRHVRRSDYTKPLFYSQNKRPYFRRHKEKVFNKEADKFEMRWRERASVALYRRIRSAAKAAGIKKRIHPHMFRHTFAVYSLRTLQSENQDIALMVVQDMMGHFSFQTTASYLHLSGRRIEGLGEKLDSYRPGLF